MTPTDESKLFEFLRWAMMTGPWIGSDLDGAAVQDKALELGLIVETKYDPDVHAGGESAEYGEPGDLWYVLADQADAPTDRASTPPSGDSVPEIIERVRAAGDTEAADTLRHYLTRNARLNRDKKLLEAALATIDEREEGKPTAWRYRREELVDIAKAFLCPKGSSEPVAGPDKEEIADKIRSLCHAWIIGADGKTIDTESIAALEVRGIEVAAEEIVRMFGASAEPTLTPQVAGTEDEAAEAMDNGRNTGGKSHR